MKHYAGIDVSLESASVCIVDERGLIVREGKVASEPGALLAWLGRPGAKVELIGLEAGPLSQWLHGGLSQAGLKVEMTAGHSFGELVALHAAGCFNEHTLFELARDRLRPGGSVSVTVGPPEGPPVRDRVGSASEGSAVGRVVRSAS